MMKKLKTYLTAKRASKSSPVSTHDLLARLVEIQNEVDKLPVLGPHEQVKLDYSLAINHLYFSSKLEGSRFTKEMLESAIYEGIR
ncbi:MAG: hypothetical protein ACYC49_00135 [Ignavibacteriaceae bacterium]